MRSSQNPGEQFSGLRRPPIRALNQRPEPIRRISFDVDNVILTGWPSRGGVIQLDHATALDLEFIGLSRVDPPRWRDPDQDTEDAFCQRLLLLGAKWFDSEERWAFVAAVVNEDHNAIDALDAGKQPSLSFMERSWVSVAFVKPMGPEEGFWVAEFDMPVSFVQYDKQNLRPLDAPLVGLAGTMAEKAEMLKGMGARFYAKLDGYDGKVCLNAWNNKTQGEVGALVKTSPSVDHDGRRWVDEYATEHYNSARDD